MPVSKKRKPKNKSNKNKRKHNIYRKSNPIATESNSLINEYYEPNCNFDKTGLYHSSFTDQDFSTIATILENEELSNDFDKKAYNLLSRNSLLSKYDKDMLLNKYEVKDICDMNESEIKSERDYLEQELEENNLNLFQFVKVDYHTDAVDESTNFYMRNLIYHRHIRGLMNSRYRYRDEIVNRICRRVININTVDRRTQIADSTTLHKVNPFIINICGKPVECDTIYVTTDFDGISTKTTMCYYIER